MALEYFLEMHTDLPISDIYARIEALLSNTATRSTRDGILKILAPGVTITAFRTDKFGRSIADENSASGITVTVAFRLDKSDNYDQGAKAAVKIALELLRTTNSDGVLDYIDTPEVLRRNGTLILEPEAAEWNHARELAQEPYELAPIPRNQLV
jgi:hypothetical protein